MQEDRGDKNAKDQAAFEDALKEIAGDDGRIDTEGPRRDIGPRPLPDDPDDVKGPRRDIERRPDRDDDVEGPRRDIGPRYE